MRTVICDASRPLSPDEMKALADNAISVLNGESEITANAHEGMKVVDIIERMYKFREL